MSTERRSSDQDSLVTFAIVVLLLMTLAITGGGYAWYKNRRATQAAVQQEIAILQRMEQELAERAKQEGIAKHDLDFVLKQARLLRNGCLHHAARTGAPPKTLRELVAPGDGNRPLIDGGEQALLDPWGREYQYDPVRVNAVGDPDPEVFAVSPDGQRISSDER